jgi:GntR family transcriptional regulator
MRRMISLGTLDPGDVVPSVRELAQRLRVNPNTVARAYQRLTDAGVFIVRRGEGTFVAEAPAQLKRSERNETLRDAAIGYASTAMAVGASLGQASDELSSAFDKLTRDHRRKP